MATTSKSRSQAADRIAKAKAAEHRAGVLSSLLLNHGQDVDVLKAVPTEALEGMLAALDAGKAAVAQAQSEAAQARKAAAAPAAAPAGKPFKYSQRARRLQRTLDRSNVSIMDTVAATVLLDPSAKGAVSVDGKEHSSFTTASRTVLRQAWSLGLLHPEYVAELEAVMAEQA